MPTEEDYKTARALAFDTLQKLNIDECCSNAGLSLERVSADEKRVAISYLGNTYYLTLAREKAFFGAKDTGLKISDQVLLLHYLMTASNVCLEDKWISFREVPSGTFYYPSFVKRAIAPLVKSFGQNPGLLEGVARVFGERGTFPGDKALKVFALPRVPVLLSLWEGDSEFPPEGNIYFDQSVPSYLPTEDIAYLAGAVVYKAIAVAQHF